MTGVAASLRGAFSPRAAGPVVLALLVHVLAALALFEAWRAPSAPAQTVRLQAIEARLLTMEQSAPEPEASTAAPPAPEPEPEPEAAPEPEPEPLPAEPVPARPEPTQETLPPPDAEAEPEPETPTEAEAPAGPSEAELEAQFGRALAAESERLAAERERQAAQQAEARTARYVDAIITEISRHWSRPPSARRGMQALLRIDLVPTGEVVGVEVLRSSGNPAFDRSAETAVRQAAPFRVPDDPALFERHFRRLRILFNPEDLEDR